MWNSSLLRKLLISFSLSKLVFSIELSDNICSVIELDTVVHKKERTLLYVAVLPFIVAAFMNTWDNFEPSSATCKRTETRVRNELHVWFDDGVRFTGFKPVSTIHCVKW